MTPIQQMLLGVGASKKIYVDDVFSTYLYWGNNANSWKQNGVGLHDDVSNRMVWFKNRKASNDHFVYDTLRGPNSAIKPNEHDITSTTNATTFANNNFQTNGFVTGYGQNGGASNHEYASWTFGTHPGFMDIVQWTGNATANRKISHSLGSVPGAIWIKRLSGSTGTNVSDWVCYHRMSNGGSYPQNFLMFLNRNVTPSNDGAGNYLYNTAPAADEFTIGSHATVNANGDTYVAYVFAHDDQQFGKGGDQSIIKCGGYTGNASSDGPTIDLGWEPQWLLIKPLDDTEDWSLFDMMRGMADVSNDPKFSTHQNNAESDATAINLRANGFQINNSNIFVNGNNSKYAYIAIRRPDGYVGKPIEDGTKCFAMDTGNSSDKIPVFNTNFVVDFSFMRNPSSSMDWYTHSRITQTRELVLNSTGSEGGAGDYTFDSNVGWGKGQDGSNTLSWMFKRHAGFDQVCYVGNATSTSRPHGLAQVPEMIWIKNRDNGSSNLIVYHKDLNNGSNPHNSFTYLDNADTPINNNSSRFGAAPTSTHFTTGTDNNTNGNNEKHIAYLFSSVSGVSSVGAYTGNGSETGPSITLGFNPRFLVIRRIDTGDNWNVFDTHRGMGSGNDKLIKFNNSNAQLTQYDLVATSSTGFSLTTTDSAHNANNGKYIYYAHA